MNLFAGGGDRKSEPHQPPSRNTPLQSTFTSWTSLGHRPVQVSGYADTAGASRFNMVFAKQPSAPAYILMAGANSTVMLKHWADLPKTGFCLSWINAHTAGGKDWFTYLYEKKACGGGQVRLALPRQGSCWPALCL